MEEYRDIKDYENYEISNLGNVRNKITGGILKYRLRNGYYYVNFYKNGKATSKYTHRLMCQTFLENPDDKPFVDHIDCNRLNNNLENLRWATAKENQHNQKIRKDNTSGTKGVIWHKKNKKWMAQIMVDGININLGYYDNIEDARDARIARANKAFGVFTNACELLKA